MPICRLRRNDELRLDEPVTITANSTARYEILFCLFCLNWYCTTAITTARYDEILVNVDRQTDRQMTSLWHSNSENNY